MKKIIKIFLLSLVLICGVGSWSHAKTIDIEELIDTFQKATDLQKNQILQDNTGKEISASGIVANAGEYDFFDITNDIKGIYYQLETEQQKTKNGTPYQVRFLFKDKESVKDLDKGQNVTKDGKIIRILDERLQISLWLFCGDLTEKEQKLLK